MGKALKCIAVVSCCLGLAAQEWVADLPARRAGSTQTLVFDDLRGRTLSFGRASFEHSFGAHLLWSYDGVSWSATDPVGQVNLSHCSHAVYDAARDRVVAIVSNWPDWQTYEFDGTAWAEIVTATATPLPDALVYDAGRQVVVMVRGYGPDCQTWEYDGVDWTLMVPFPRPPARDRMWLSYDRVRQRVVMFGGQQAPPPTPIFETWEYDGNSWIQPSLTTTPNTQGPMCFDEVSGRLLMMTTPTWAYDGTDWSVAAPSAPVPVPQVAYDRTRDVVVALGTGVSAPWTLQVLELELGQWHTLFPQPIEAHATMVTDAANNRVLLCGDKVWQRTDSKWSTLGSGHGDSVVFDASRGRLLALEHEQITNGGSELWQWQSGVWTQLWTTQTPGTGPLSTAAVAYDPAHDVMVTFGGRTTSGVPSNETHEWDGTQWTQLLGPAPPARHRANMVYSHALGGIVLFGGSDYGVTPFPDTWLFKDGAWQQIITPQTPGGRTQHTLCEDRARGVILLRGGLWQGTFGSAETWQFDGIDWTLVTAVGPEQNDRAAATIDAKTGELVVFGGLSTSPNTFQLRRPGEALAARYGVGCPGSIGVPQLDNVGALPQLGATLDIALSNVPTSGVAMLWFGFDVDLWQGVRLPLDLTFVGLPGCRMWAASAPGLLHPITTTGNVASMQLTLPTSPQLAGEQFAAQALVIDPQVAAGAVTSNAVLWTLW